jgi:hypothetical protein
MVIGYWLLRLIVKDKSTHTNPPEGGNLEGLMDKNNIQASGAG